MLLAESFAVKSSSCHITKTKTETKSLAPSLQPVRDVAVAVLLNGYWLTALIVAAPVVLAAAQVLLLPGTLFIGVTSVFC